MLAPPLPSPPEGDLLLQRQRASLRRQGAGGGLGGLLIINLRVITLSIGKSSVRRPVIFITLKTRDKWDKSIFVRLAAINLRRILFVISALLIFSLSRRLNLF